MLNQDQTLGNLLKTELLENKEQVLFAGYFKPHPLENQVKIKIQTTDRVHPVRVLSETIQNIRAKNESLQRQFDDQVKELMK